MTMKQSDYRWAKLGSRRPPRMRLPRLPRKRPPLNLPTSQWRLAKLKRRTTLPVRIIPTNTIPVPPSVSCANGWL